MSRRPGIIVARLCAAVVGAGFAAACGSSPSPATPTSNEAAVVPTSGSGPVQITFLSASPSPGSTISGCGANPTGCQGRLSMTFLLRSSASGRLRSGAVWLFDANGSSGCFVMSISPMDLSAGAGVVTTLRADIASEFCPMPLDIDRMVARIYEESSLRSEQGFRVRYVFLP